jgi:hypothetical protein
MSIPGPFQLHSKPYSPEALKKINKKMLNESYVLPQQTIIIRQNLKMQSSTQENKKQLMINQEGCGMAGAFNIQPQHSPRQGTLEMHRNLLTG